MKYPIARTTDPLYYLAREGAASPLAMLGLVEAKVAQEALMFVQEILAFVYTIASIVKGIKGKKIALLLDC